MNAEFTKGFYLGPLRDYSGKPIVEEEKTTDGEFVPILGTRIEICVNKHEAGKAAEITLVLKHDDGDSFIHQVVFEEGSAYFGFSRDPRGLAFTHEKSQPTE